MCQPPIGPRRGEKNHALSFHSLVKGRCPFTRISADRSVPNGRRGIVGRGGWSSAKLKADKCPLCQCFNLWQWKYWEEKNVTQDSKAFLKLIVARGHLFCPLSSFPFPCFPSSSLSLQFLSLSHLNPPLLSLAMRFYCSILGKL